MKYRSENESDHVLEARRETSGDGQRNGFKSEAGSTDEQRRKNAIQCEQVDQSVER